tara:strand:+ start:329 stop:1477 length:1149 start_codon:yes stop_codon:yes gene_type:complete
VVLVFFAVAYTLRKEPFKVLLIFCHIIVIFLLNDVLFPASYMPDQFRYVRVTQELRGFEDPSEKLNSTIGFSSLLFSALPIPFINSVHSIAMMNFLIFLVLFLFIKKFGLHSQKVDYFYLIFPSLLLYSSLALRDMLVLFFMFISIYAVIVKENFFLGLLLGIPILLLKFQNYLIILGGIILFFYLKNAGKRRYLFLGLFVFLAAFIPEKIPIVKQLYEKIEWWRFALFADQYSYNMDVINRMKQYYEPLGTGIILLYQVFKYFIYMILKPLIWEADNPFQFIQSIENVVIFGMIIWVNHLKIFNEKIRQKILFLNCLLFVSMTINGLVVFNFGSAARYKFPFIVIYFVYFFYLLKSDELFVHQAKTAWNGNSPISPTLSID